MIDDWSVLEERIRERSEECVAILDQVGAMDPQDEPALRGHLQKLAAIKADFTAITKQVEAELAAVKDAAAASAAAGSIPGLIAGFKLCCRLDLFANEFLQNVELVNATRSVKSDIVQALDKIPPGMGPSLLPLLDDPEPVIRVKAAIFLLRPMPDRADPVIRAAMDDWTIDQSVRNSAFFELSRYYDTPDGSPRPKP